MVFIRYLPTLRGVDERKTLFVALPDTANMNIKDEVEDLALTTKEEMMDVVITKAMEEEERQLMEEGERKEREMMEKVSCTLPSLTSRLPACEYILVRYRLPLPLVVK